MEYYSQLIKIMKQIILKKLMKAFATNPKPTDYNLREIFNHQTFTNSHELKRYEIMEKSSRTLYLEEMSYPLDNYFGFDLMPLLKDRVVLDIGCFTGGRSIAWYERYHFEKIYGVDVDTTYIEAATNFAKKKAAVSEFVCARGELLPFRENTFDVVLSVDVFEHVQDLTQVMLECKRVLKPGGKLYTVFPGYYQPKEHHLTLATAVPFIHYFVSGKDLIRAYNEILGERGEEANWYKRTTKQLEPWEKCNSINGTTLRSFRRMIKETEFDIYHESCFPLLKRKPRLKYISYFILPFALLPFFEEFLRNRIVFILEKP